MKYINIENKVGKVRLNDTVTPISTDELIGDIERLYGEKAVAENMVIGGFTACAENALEVLDLEVHTPGGSVLDGYRIYHSLMQMRSRGVRVNATVNTLAASMGSVIIMAADEVNIVKGGRIMIHEAAQSLHGDSVAHERAAKILNEMSDEIAAIYAERTGKTKEEMRGLMKKETWMGAQEALDRGFADNLVSLVPQNQTNQVDIQTTNPKPTPMKLIDRLTQPSNEEAIGKIEALEKQIESHDSVIQEFQDKLDVAENALQEAAGFKAQIETLTNEVSAITTERDGLKAQVEEFEAKLEEAQKETAEAKESADDKAIEILASVGQEAPLQIDESKPDEITAKSREEFNALTPAARLAFVKAGGRLK